jgi:hypothetical protein
MFRRLMTLLATAALVLQGAAAHVPCDGVVADAPMSAHEHDAAKTSQSSQSSQPSQPSQPSQHGEHDRHLPADSSGGDDCSAPMTRADCSVSACAQSVNLVALVATMELAPTSNAPARADERTPVMARQAPEPPPPRA